MVIRYNNPPPTMRRPLPRAVRATTPMNISEVFDYDPDLKCWRFSTLFWWTWWDELTPCTLKSTFKLGFSISRAPLQWEILTHLVSFSFCFLYNFLNPYLAFGIFVLIWVVFWLDVEVTGFIFYWCL